MPTGAPQGLRRSGGGVSSESHPGIASPCPAPPHSCRCLLGALPLQTLVSSQALDSESTSRRNQPKREGKEGRPYCVPHSEAQAEEAQPRGADSQERSLGIWALGPEVIDKPGTRTKLPLSISLASFLRKTEIPEDLGSQGSPEKPRQ